MSDARPITAPAEAPDDPQQALRMLGARAHQLRATTRAADHFNSRDTVDGRDTGSWLISSALELSRELACDINSLARSLKDHPADATWQNRVSALRVRAHQLHAAARAADHFLDQDTSDDRETGSWLIATARGLADKLACELDDSSAPPRRATSIDKSSIEPHDAALSRRLAAATTPLRGAA